MNFSLNVSLLSYKPGRDRQALGHGLQCVIRPLSGSTAISRMLTLDRLHVVQGCMCTFKTVRRKWQRFESLVIVDTTPRWIRRGAYGGWVARETRLTRQQQSRLWHHAAAETAVDVRSYTLFVVYRQRPGACRDDTALLPSIYPCASRSTGRYRRPATHRPTFN